MKRKLNLVSPESPGAESLALNPITEVLTIVFKLPRMAAAMPRGVTKSSAPRIRELPPRRAIVTHVSANNLAACSLIESHVQREISLAVTEC